MNEPPANTNNLLQHQKILDTITYQYHRTQHKIRRYHWDLQRLLYKKQAAERRLAFLEDRIKYHQDHLT